MNINRFKFYFLVISFSKTFAIKNYLSTPDNNLRPEDQQVNWYWNKEDYPNPLEEPQFCKRIAPSFVCDPELILKQNEANLLDEIIKKINENTICLCSYCPPDRKGLSFGVALMRNIYQDYNVFPSKNAEDFAHFLRKRWKLGICENDVLILVVTKQDQVAIVHGATAQNIFPPLIAEDIFMGSKKSFEKGDYFTALKSILTSYQATLRNLQSAPRLVGDNKKGTHQPQSANYVLIIGLTIGFLAIIALLVGALLYVKKKVNEDDSKLQFKGMLSRGYWLSRKEPLQSVSPTVPTGGGYEPCSIEDPREPSRDRDDDDVDRRLKEKLSQISDSCDSDDEEIAVIDNNCDQNDVNLRLSDLRLNRADYVNSNEQKV